MTADQALRNLRPELDAMLSAEVTTEVEHV